MNILLLGGTGAIGKALTPLLLKTPDNKVYITSRGGSNSDNPQLTFLQCNAMHDDDLRKVLSERKYDAIVDFMNYRTDDFKRRYELLLTSTSHYIFLSSCRVFADAPIINESSPQLLDKLSGNSYLNGDTYTLAKARCEKVLKESSYSNYTIVRPYITYNSNRFQLGIYEKEHFLYRALHGRSIVISKDILEKKTSLTSAVDVAELIGKIILEAPSCHCYNLVDSEPISWNDVLNIYRKEISNWLGKEMKVMIVDNSFSESRLISSEEKYNMDRLYNRVFSSNEEIVRMHKFIRVDEGLKQSLSNFFLNPKFGRINWRYEAYIDKITNERSKLNEIPSWRTKIHYMLWRFR